MEEQEILHAGREQLKFLNVRNRKKKRIIVSKMDKRDFIRFN